MKIVEGILEFPKGITQCFPLCTSTTPMTDPFSTEFYFDSFFEPDSPPRLHTSSVLAFEGNQDERPPLLSQTSFNERGNIDYSFIDLTHDTISPAMEERNRGPRPRSLYKSDPSSDEDDTPTPVAKRRRIGNRETRLMAPEKVETKIEEADLRDVDDDHGLSKVLEQQRASTIKAQRGESNKSLLITNQQCVVCMEDMTNITATHCGKFPRK